MWIKLRKLAEENSDGINWATSRLSKKFHGVSDAYVKFVGGTLSGAMARFDEDHPSLTKLLEGLEYRGQGLGEIQKVAEKKAKIYSRL